MHVDPLGLKVTFCQGPLIVFKKRKYCFVHSSWDGFSHELHIKAKIRDLVTSKGLFNIYYKILKSTQKKRE